MGGSLEPIQSLYIVHKVLRLIDFGCKVRRSTTIRMIQKHDPLMRVFHLHNNCPLKISISSYGKQNQLPWLSMLKDWHPKSKRPLAYSSSDRIHLCSTWRWPVIRHRISVAISWLRPFFVTFGAWTAWRTARRNRLRLVQDQQGLRSSVLFRENLFWTE